MINFEFGHSVSPLVSSLDSSSVSSLGFIPLRLAFLFIFLLMTGAHQNALELDHCGSLRSILKHYETL